MKIRFGVGLGAQTNPADFGAVVDALEAARVDSLWFSELVYSDSLEPFVAMAYALSRTSRLKVGTSVAVLPGRHPVLVAKQLASLAGLAPGRVLPAFGLRPARTAEHALFPVPDGQRAAVFDESLSLLKAALSSDVVNFNGRFFSVESARIRPLPVKPLDIWLGGSAPAGLRRVGRYGDGWLGSFLTGEEAGLARKTIQAAAAEAGREIEPDHFGISIGVADGGIGDTFAAASRQRRPDVDPRELTAESWPHLHQLLDSYIEAGLTKFVIRPSGPQPFDEFLDRYVSELHPRQN